MGYYQSLLRWSDVSIRELENPKHLIIFKSKVDIPYLILLFLALLVFRDKITKSLSVLAVLTHTLLILKGLLVRTDKLRCLNWLSWIDYSNVVEAKIYLTSILLIAASLYIFIVLDSLLHANISVKDVTHSVIVASLIRVKTLLSCSTSRLMMI